MQLPAPGPHTHVLLSWHKLICLTSVVEGHRGYPHSCHHPGLSSVEKKNRNYSFSPESSPPWEAWSCGGLWRVVEGCGGQALEVSHPGVSKSFLGHGKMGKMGKMGGKWGKMGENGGKCGVWDARARLLATVTSLTTHMIATQAFSRRCIQSEESFCHLVYHSQFILAHGGGTTPLKQKET